jgi:hypothetical protein
MKKRINKAILYLIYMLLVPGLFMISSCYRSNRNVIKNQLPDGVTIESKLREEVEVWSGTPYKHGGRSQDGLDCCAFIGLVFKNVFGISLPRTSIGISKTGN